MRLETRDDAAGVVVGQLVRGFVRCAVVDLHLDALIDGIVHVADAYDAMTSARAYRGARPSGDALRELWRCAGTEFDAEIVGALAIALPGVTTEHQEPPIVSQERPEPVLARG